MGSWQAWLEQAHAIVQAWEETRGGRILQVREAIDLAERIARALDAAYRRGREGPGRAEQ